jgi:hypothetical protein
MRSLRIPRSMGMFCYILVLIATLTADAGSAETVKALRSRKRFLQSVETVSLLQEEAWLDRSGTQMRLEAGSHVRLKGLESTDDSDVNGKQGMIQAYDPYSGHYIITMTSGGSARRIRPENLELLELSEINDDPVADGDRFRHGAHVMVFGLRSLPELNGKVGVVRHFDFGTGRYVVEIPGAPPKRIKPANLRLATGRGGRGSISLATGRGSISLDHRPNPGGAGASSVCQSSTADAGPSDLAKGTEVRLFGLRSPVARPWNGLVAIVHCFDASSQRYVVALPDGSPRKIKPENLKVEEGSVIAMHANREPSDDSGSDEPSPPRREPSSQHRPRPRAGGAASICQTSDDAGPDGWSKGTKVRLHGLKSQTARPWNGLEAIVHCFDASSQRYVVALADGTPRKIKSVNLEAADGSTQALQESGGSPTSSGKDSTGTGGASICKTQQQPGFRGPGGLTIGAKVILHGLKSAAALHGKWNGMIGVVHCFDSQSQRYVVQCEDKMPRKLKAVNLLPADKADQFLAGPGGSDGGKQSPKGASICQQQASSKFVGPGGLTIGSKVRLHGLKSAAAVKGGWNGMVGVLHCFLPAEHRIVVACPDGLPRKLKLANLERVGATAPESQPDSEGAPQAGHAQSVCQPQLSGEKPAVGPGGLPIGTKVALFGLTSKAAVSGGWNGMVGIIHCFEPKSSRYVVAMSDGHPRKLKVENLAIVTTAVTQPTQNQTTNSSIAPKKVQWLKGAYVRLAGLKAAAELNGQVGSVVAFENSTQRYIVKIPGISRLKRIRVDNLEDVASSEPTTPSPIVAAAANIVGAPSVAGSHSGSGHQLSICNAYATHSPIQVFAVSSDGKHYTHIVKGLDFQSCSDVDNLDSDKVASLAFIIGKFQVAKKVVDFSTLTPGQGLELVVFRKDQNSLQALVHENPVEIGDNEAYYLHIVNAYAGRKSLELHVQRGKFLKKLPLDKTFRLATTQAINMVLSDGSQKLRLAFQPRRAKTYCIMTTGVDTGLRGEARPVGIVAHEIGAWTSSEEMVNEDSNSAATGQNEGSADGNSNDEVEDAPEKSAPAHPLGLASVIGRLFGGSGGS